MKDMYGMNLIYLGVKMSDLCECGILKTKCTHPNCSDAECPACNQIPCKCEDESCESCGA